MRLAVRVAGLLLRGGPGDLDRRTRNAALLRVLHGHIDPALKERLRGRGTGAGERQRQGQAAEPARARRPDSG